MSGKLTDARNAQQFLRSAWSSIDRLRDDLQPSYDIVKLHTAIVLALYELEILANRLDREV